MGRAIRNIRCLLAPTMFFLIFSGGMDPAWAASKVTMIQSVDALSFAPIYVAIGKGFFKQEGIDLDFTVVRGGPAAAAGFLSGEAPFLSTGSDTPVVLMARGQKNVLVVNSFARALTFQVIAGNKWLNKAAVNPRAPAVQKLQAMKGATFGAPSLGGLSEHVIRYYLQNVGGLKRGDVSVVAVGFGAALVSALATGQIDGFGASPPAGPEIVSRGLGQILLSGWDIPELGNMVYEVLTIKKEYGAANSEVVRKMVRAVARGTNYVPSHLEESTRVIQARFKRMKPEVVAESVRSLVPAFGGSGRMTEAMWANSMKLWKAGTVKEDVDIKEGGLWTNRYIVNIPKD